jgi:hypothetical protein
MEFAVSAVWRLCLLALALWLPSLHFRIALSYLRWGGVRILTSVIHCKETVHIVCLNAMLHVSVSLLMCRKSWNVTHDWKRCMYSIIHPATYSSSLRSFRNPDLPYERCCCFIYGLPFAFPAYLHILYQIPTPILAVYDYLQPVGPG